MMAAPVLILTSVAPIHAEAIKLAKTQSDHTNAYLVELERNQMALNVSTSTNVPRVSMGVAE